MDRFSKYNPKVTFLFFLLVIVCNLIMSDPICLSLGLSGGFLFNLRLQGKRAFKELFAFALPLILLSALFNMLFTSWGSTVLFTLLSKPFTFEGLFYGFSRGLMFAGVIMWISCYSLVLSTDRFLAVFSNALPNISLLLSAVLSFIPRLRENAGEINDSRRLIDDGKTRLQKSLDNFSSLLSMTLEESIELSDSMRARGFNKNRKAYSKYRLFAGDFVVLIFICIIFACIIALKIKGCATFVYEPEISMNGFSPLSAVACLLLNFLPVIIDLTEDIKWFYLKQKI
ncbi:MAG: energy-coupling factor transporter transmembrane component T family protein [Eubacterium sp.]